MKQTNKHRTKDDYWAAEVSMVGWGHRAWATDERFVVFVLFKSSSATSSWGWAKLRGRSAHL